MLSLFNLMNLLEFKAFDNMLNIIHNDTLFPKSLNR